MLEEQELLEAIQQGLLMVASRVLDGMQVDELPTENAACHLTLVDGTKFHVVVTKIEDGE